MAKSVASLRGKSLNRTVRAVKKSVVSSSQAPIGAPDIAEITHPLMDIGSDRWWMLGLGAMRLSRELSHAVLNLNNPTFGLNRELRGLYDTWNPAPARDNFPWANVLNP